MLGLVDAFFLSRGDTLPLTGHLIFQDQYSLFQPLNMHALLMCYLLFLDQLLLKPHLLVYDLLLDGRFDTLKSDIVIYPFLVLFVDDLCLQVRHFQLQSDVFILDEVELSLKLVEVFLSGHFALKGA